VFSIPFAFHPLKAEGGANSALAQNLTRLRRALAFQCIVGMAGSGV
jgi:hypothetical protein